MDVSGTWFRDESGALFGIALYQDISDRVHAASLARENEERLQYLAFHDPLTQLPNRAFLNERLRHAMAKARRRMENVAVLFLDLDRFKQINDSLGHEIGDRLLCHVALCLRALLRGNGLRVLDCKDLDLYYEPQVDLAETLANLKFGNRKGNMIKQHLHYSRNSRGGFLCC